MTTATMIVSDSLTITKRNVIKIRRVPDVLIFSTLSPIMFVLLFACANGAGGSLIEEVETPLRRSFSVLI